MIAGSGRGDFVIAWAGSRHLLDGYDMLSWLARAAMRADAPRAPLALWQRPASGAQALGGSHLRVADAPGRCGAGRPG